MGQNGDSGMFMRQILRMASRLKRYLDGEHEQVWTELVALGAGVRGPYILADAEAVAHETTGRVRDNVDGLTLRLTAAGYAFGLPDGDAWILCPARRAPDEHVPAQIARLEALAGQLLLFSGLV